MSCLINMINSTFKRKVLYTHKIFSVTISLVSLNNQISQRPKYTSNLCSYFKDNSQISILKMGSIGHTEEKWDSWNHSLNLAAKALALCLAFAKLLLHAVLKKESQTWTLMITQREIKRCRECWSPAPRMPSKLKGH